MASNRGNLFKAQFGFELEDATIEQLRGAATKALAAQTKTAAQQAFLKTVPKPNPLSGRTQADIIFGQNVFGTRRGGDPELIAAAKAVGITGPNVLKGLGDTTAFAGQLPEDFFGLFLSNNGITDASQISDQDLVKFSNEAATQFFENNKKGGLFGSTFLSPSNLAKAVLPALASPAILASLTTADTVATGANIAKNTLVNLGTNAVTGGSTGSAPPPSNPSSGSTSTEPTEEEDVSLFKDILGVAGDIAGIIGVAGTAIDLLTGASADAAKDAASVQGASIDKAIASNEKTTQAIIDANKEALATSRGDLEPFRQAGENQLAPLAGDINNLSNLVNDPNVQKDFVTNNPFFDALADDAQRRLFNNQAARGKVGSGGTAEALQNSILLLGTDLVNQNVNQRQGVITDRQNLVSLGSNAAAGQATLTQNTAGSNASASSVGNRTLTDLTTTGGDVTASGIVAAQNAKTRNLDQLITIGLNI